VTAPVAFYLFNRPEHTRRVFAWIREARPERLFLIADGPRHEAEHALCEQARAVVAGVDWPCEVLRNFSPVNLGLRRRLESGNDWVFQHTPEAILLEDDCLPDPSFFAFCTELLNRYRDEPRVMAISGNGHIPHPPPGQSFWYSRYAYYWGWATWARAWRQYDAELSGWTDPDTRRGFLRGCETLDERLFWRRTFRRVQNGTLDSCGYRWTFSVAAHNGLCIHPSVNLVQNIGFGPDSTHTKHAGDPLVRLEAQPIAFPLVAPAVLAPDYSADRQFVRVHYSLSRRAWRRMKRAMRIRR
jgi:hypothetical protein